MRRTAMLLTVLGLSLASLLALKNQNGVEMALIATAKGIE